MEELSKSFPKDITYKIQHDETEFVRDSEAHPGCEDKIKVSILTGNAEEETGILRNRPG